MHLSVEALSSARVGYVMLGKFDPGIVVNLFGRMGDPGIFSFIQISFQCCILQSNMELLIIGVIILIMLILYVSRKAREDKKKQG